MEILTLMTKRGYRPDERGVCYGIASMACRANVRKDYDSFLERMKFIKNNNFESIQNSIKNGDEYQIKAFLEELYIYQGVSRSWEIDPERNLGDLTTQDFRNVTKMYNNKSDNMEERQLIEKNKEILIFKNSNELEIFLKKHNSHQTNATYLIRLDGHTVALSLNNGHWYYQDHEDQIDSENQYFTKLLFHRLKSLQGNVAIASFVALDEHASKTLNRTKNTNIAQFTGFKGFRGSSSLFLAMREGSSKHIKLYMNELKLISERLKFKQEILARILKERLLSSNCDGYPALFAAVSQGKTQAIETYMKCLRNLIQYLDPIGKKEILLAKGQWH